MSSPSDVAGHVAAVAARAKEASLQLAGTTIGARRSALERIAGALERNVAALLKANAADVADARAEVEQGTMQASLLERLAVNHEKIVAMAAQVRAVAALDDPIGRVLEQRQLAAGPELCRVSCPLGVVAAIFEARPDAITQIVALALMAGNAVVLKPGHEARRSARVLGHLIHRALRETDEISADTVAFVEGRDAVDALLTLDGVIDLVVPRGSKALVRYVQSHTAIPVLGHADGICHVYIDETAMPGMAAAIVVDSKVQYPAACNAAEVVLIHRAAAAGVLDGVISGLTARGVALRACERVRARAPEMALAAASELDWRTEFGELVAAVKLVDSLDEAVAHINAHGSHHTDAIVTEDPGAAAHFLLHVDSANVLHNVSTRFSDGYRYGLGAEVGISTGKLHARGPVGVMGLTSSKYIVRGSGEVVGGLRH
jgi:glutamate-5-semialdehyde dehydrogenase